MFSNAGTIAKFDRTGVVAGFAEPGVRYVRAIARPWPFASPFAEAARYLRGLRSARRGDEAQPVTFAG
jgi:hypothetical protein